MQIPRWTVKATLMTLRTHWFSLIGEQLETPEGQQLDYWRIERADSVIVLSLQNDQFLLPLKQYRPGIGEATLDFPGGRIDEGESPTAAARRILHRELDIGEDAITELIPLNTTGWSINSSFSNQRLYGFVAVVAPHHSMTSEKVGTHYPVTMTGVKHLRSELTCLQCRMVLAEWWESASTARFRNSLQP